MRPLDQFFTETRQRTELLVETLSSEDMVVQSMPDASPAKWHLGHTTWFYETFILSEYLPQYRQFQTNFSFLFNSYYETAGERHPRPKRGLLTRPSLQEVMAYRCYVDEHMLRMIEDMPEAVADLVIVGLHHEMQHQELLLTDILHLFHQNSLLPAVFEKPVPDSALDTAVEPMGFVSHEGGVYSVGAAAEGFSYDCERPQHSTMVSPFRLADRLVTNREWIEFMDDGGYKEPLLWMSDGWATRVKSAWQAPLYWHEHQEQWHQFGLDGLQPLDLDAPVCHVSFYEADAFARWAGKRLPREHELEIFAQQSPIEGNFLQSRNWRPQKATQATGQPRQLHGDVWEWTQSAYSAYPGFKSEQGALGEYNGKFMVNQFVLKGGSCVTAEAQMRSSYRNFFYPHQRWQFMGLRLAVDD